MKQTEKARRAVFIIFILYCITMLLLLFARRTVYFTGSYAEQLKMNLNLVPFDTMRRFIYVLRHSSNPYMLKFAHINLGGNVAAFVPFGFFLPYLYAKQRKFIVFFASAVGTIVAVELTQLFTLRGSCDIDDLILNLIGSILGFLSWRIFAGAAREKS